MRLERLADAAAAAARPTVTPEGLAIADPSDGWLIAAAYVVLGAALTAGSLRLVPFALGWRDIPFGAFLLAAAAIGSSVRVRINEKTLQGGPVIMFIVVTAVLLGPVAAAVVGGVAGAWGTPSPRAATTFYVGLGLLEGAAAGLVAHAVLPGAERTGPGLSSAAVAGSAAATWIAGQAVMHVVRRVPRHSIESLVGTTADGVVAVAFAPALIVLHERSPAAAVVLGVALIAIFAAGAKYRERLLRLKTEVERLSRTDALTGVANRRAFDERLEFELRRAARTGSALAVILVDLDRFKDVNDRNGHPAGDAVLTEVAQCLAGRLRLDDLLARLGGDEFGAIVSGLYGQALEALAGTLCGLVATCAVGPDAIQVTASVGAAARTRPVTAEELVRAADDALYAAKARGRAQAVTG